MIKKDTKFYLYTIVFNDTYKQPISMIIHFYIYLCDLANRLSLYYNKNHNLLAQEAHRIQRAVI